MVIMVVISLVLCFASPCWGQHSENTDVIGSLLSDRWEESMQEGASNQELIANEFVPLNLNKVSYDQLRVLTWLSPLQIKSLQNYLEEYGPLVSIYELQAVPGWDLATIRLTEPYIYIPESAAYYDARIFKHKLGHNGRLEFVIRAKRRLELSKGYSETGKARFLGSPNYWLYRIRYREQGAISFGITMEKDAGERFRWDPKTYKFGPDYLSMHLVIENKGVLKKLLIGDFRARWDQGLIINNSFNLGHQIITGPNKVHTGLIAHSGSQEYRFFRGIGIELELLNISISAFYSIQKLDAQVLAIDSLNNLPPRISSILETGLHRTPIEVERKSTVSDQIAGIHLRKQWSESLTIGLSALSRNLKFPLIPRPNSYNRHWFKGRKNFNYSASIEYIKNNVNLFGQFALSASNGSGLVAGFIISLSHNASISVHLRNFTRGFHGVAGDAFGITTNNLNEQGIYWGMQITPAKKWVTGLYVNAYRIPGPSFAADGFSQGIDQLARVQYFPSKSTFLNFYWKSRVRTQNSSPSLNKLTKDLTPVKKYAVGIRSKCVDKGNFTLFSNIQYSKQIKDQGRTEGLAVSSRVSYELKFLKFTLSTALFNTDDFDNRQYMYEQGFPYSLSIPFFEGAGMRWYLLMRAKIVENLDFWFRLAQSRYSNRAMLSNGVDTIIGNKRTDLGFQIRYKL